MALIPLGERAPADAALVCSDGELSWSELERRANQRARLFRSLGVRRQDIVAVVLDEGILLHEIILGIWKCEATPNIVAPSVPAPELEALLASARPRLVVGARIDLSRRFKCIAANVDSSAFSEVSFPSKADPGQPEGDGFLLMADRCEDLIVRGGVDIHAAEVEAFLDAHPSITSSVVIGVPCPDLGQRLHAILQPGPAENVDIHDIAEFLEDYLPEHKQPESYEIVDYALRDAAGRAQRSDLHSQRLEWLAKGQDFRRFLRFRRSRGTAVA